MGCAALAAVIGHTRRVDLFQVDDSGVIGQRFALSVFGWGMAAIIVSNVGILEVLHTFSFRFGYLISNIHLSLQPRTRFLNIPLRCTHSQTEKAEQLRNRVPKSIRYDVATAICVMKLWPLTVTADLE